MILSCNSTYLPFSTAKEGLPGSLPPTYCPGPSTVGCTAVNGTLVYEYELISVICTYTSSKIGSFLGTSLDRNAGELIKLLVIYYWIVRKSDVLSSYCIPLL